MVLRQIRVPYDLNYDFGIGVDLVSGSPMNKVVEGDISGVEFAGGSMTQIAVERIHTTAELENKLGIDAEASFGFGFFGASARFNFAKDRKVQTDSLFLAISASVTLKNLSIDKPTLNAEAVNLVNRPDVFSTRFGNMFVRGVERGGLFVGLMQINASNSQESEAISTELQGSYGFFSADFKTKIENIMRNKRIEISLSIYQEGGPENINVEDISNPKLLIDIVSNWLESFKVNPDKNAFPYFITLAPITIANGPIPPNEVDIQHAQDILKLCTRERSRILDNMNLMDFILRRSSIYDFVAPTTLNDIAKAFNGFQEDLDLVAATASQAINDASKAVTPAEFASKTGKEYPHVFPDPMPTLKAGFVPPTEPGVIIKNFRGQLIKIEKPGGSILENLGHLQLTKKP